MSVQALTWVLDYSPAQGGDRLVLISLANHADREGRGSYPPVPMIAREARMSDRNVQYALRSLERGFDGSGRAIEREGIGPNRASLWRVLMDEQAKAFRGIPRPRGGADVAPSENPGSGAISAPSEGEAPTSDVAPSRVQHATALNARGCDGEPSVNRQEHPPPPSIVVRNDVASGGVQLGPALTPLPSSGRRRELAHIEARRQDELRAWLAEHPATAALHTELAPILQHLRGRVDEGTFTIWIAPLHAHEISDSGLVLGTDPSLAAWTADRYGELLSQIAERPVRVIACPCPPYAFPLNTDERSEAVA